MLKFLEQFHSNIIFYPCQQENSNFLNSLLEFLFKLVYNRNMKSNKEFSYGT
nr:MAG TPA: hypothetical protein [Caudoviricetes sp.]